MEQSGQVLVNGLILAGTYALMAIGLTLVFGFMDLVNFAHGEFYMFGAYFAFTTIVILELPFWVGLPLGLLGVMGLAYILDVVILRPLRDQDILTKMLTTIGLMLVFQNAALLIWGPVQKRLPVPVSTTSWALGSIRVAPIHILTGALAVAIILVLHFYMQRTKSGIAMRATFQDREIAGLMGVNANSVYAKTFAIGAGLAATGGSILAMVFLMTPTMGELATLRAFTVVILGGLGSFPGAIVGGILVGLSESLSATYIASGYKDAIAFLLLLIILMVRPQGIFGKAGAVES